jgi:tartrate-resistant acid phosphatase type 5
MISPFNSNTHRTLILYNKIRTLHLTEDVPMTFYKLLPVRLFCLTVMLCLWACASVEAQTDHVRIAVIGDYGLVSQPEEDVSNLVKSWNPDFIITVGDNNYQRGEASTIDQNIGQYYHDFIAPYRGSFGAGASVNRFFPSLGNHDWGEDVQNNAAPYLDYFTLPGNERYYDFTRGPVQLYAVDSEPQEPDGVTSDSAQGTWLKNRLALSAVPWRLVYFHHPSYSSGSHGSTPWMQWPFQNWGATAVLTGHDHHYERLLINNFPYFVNGNGGLPLRAVNAPIEGSRMIDDRDNGAMLVEADLNSISFKFYTRAGVLIDSYTINASGTVANLIDLPKFFVLQHYQDFLGREPEQAGLDYWTAQITKCGDDPACLDARRIGVSAAFFVEQEFQQTGYVVYRMHRAAFGTLPAPNQSRANILYAQFTSDRSQIVGGDQLAQSALSFANGFVQRAQFKTAYPDSLSATDFVNKLYDTAGLSPFTTERASAIQDLTNNAKTRAQVLLDLIEIPAFKSREYNPSFVLMQYFGYLRRDPEQGGYLFWLNVLNNSEPNNYRGMVCSFITSAEYQLRFGSTVTHTNQECSAAQ